MPLLKVSKKSIEQNIRIVLFMRFCPFEVVTLSLSTEQNIWMLVLFSYTYFTVSCKILQWGGFYSTVPFKSGVRALGGKFPLTAAFKYLLRLSLRSPTYDTSPSYSLNNNWNYRNPGENLWPLLLECFPAVGHN